MLDNEQEIIQLVRREMEQDKIQEQYGVNKTPVHTHNGMDTPRLDFGGSLVNRQLFISSHIQGTSAATSSNYGHFFINDLLPPSSTNATTGGLTIITMTEVHGQAGSDGAAVTVGVCILNPGDSSISGATPIHAFNLKLSADVPRVSTFKHGGTPAVVYPGQRLALQTSGTLTSVADVLVTVLLQY